MVNVFGSKFVQPSIRHAISNISVERGDFAMACHRLRTLVLNVVITQFLYHITYYFKPHCIYNAVFINKTNKGNIKILSKTLCCFIYIYIYIYIYFFFFFCFVLFCFSCFVFFFLFFFMQLCSKFSQPKINQHDKISVCGSGSLALYKSCIIWFK